MSPKADLRVRKAATLSSDCTAPRSVIKGQARSGSVISSPGGHFRGHIRSTGGGDREPLGRSLIFGGVFALRVVRDVAVVVGAVFGPRIRPAGISHFTILQVFCNICPGRGAWGFWYLPGTASFHVKWTGIAEIAGGVGLALGGLGVGADVGLERAAAAGLFILTLAVTPANIYMFSHGAQLPEGLEAPIAGHAIRGLLQCFLLAFFWTLANQ